MSSPALSLDLAPAASTVHAPSVLALDLSLTATGWAKSDGSSVVSSGVLRTPEELDGMERIKWILDSVWNLTEDAHFTVIEGYAFDRPNQAHQIGELGGVVRFTLWEGGRPFVLIAPSSMKMFATGKGNASKDEVLACAIRKLDYLGFSKDEADALFPARHGPRALRRPRAHREADAGAREDPVATAHKRQQTRSFRMTMPDDLPPETRGELNV
jgi:crossover junction endodeoxyribonuclease RuvC